MEKCQTSFDVAVQKMQVLPGDVVVITSKEKMSAAIASRCIDLMRQTLQQAGIVAPVIVLDDGMGISILSKAEAGATVGVTE